MLCLYKTLSHFLLIDLNLLRGDKGDADALQGQTRRDRQIIYPRGPSQERPVQRSRQEQDPSELHKPAETRS